MQSCMSFIVCSIYAISYLEAMDVYTIKGNNYNLCSTSTNLSLIIILKNFIGYPNKASWQNYQFLVVNIKLIHSMKLWAILHVCKIWIVIAQNFSVLPTHKAERD